MLTLILAYLGGALTILSPCVLPVVPFIFSRSDQPFRKSGLPMLVGMGLSFATFAALSVTGARWVVQANQLGRVLALVVFTLLGFTLLLPRFADRVMQPIVRLGGLLQKRADAGSGLGSSLLLGAAVGLLWAPCAGPILGLVLAGSALGEPGAKTFFLLLVFALGAATPLGIAIFAGGKALRVMKKGFAAEEWIKRALGVIVLASVAAIALGLDTKILAQIGFLNTGALEQRLIAEASGAGGAGGGKIAAKNESLASEGVLTPLTGATSWLNSPPLAIDKLRGKVVLVDFWTYSCINCLRTLPYLKAWAEKYRDQGLVVIGVHTPEFAFEKDEANVGKAVRELGISYPVAIDSEQAIWNAYKNQYWPAHYLADARGVVRSHHFGEGDYAETERVIRRLLQELHGEGGAPLPTAAVGDDGALPAGNAMKAGGAMNAQGGVQAPSSIARLGSPESYLGYERQAGFASQPALTEDRQDEVALYREPAELSLNQWALGGSWRVGDEAVSLEGARGALSFRFQARDLHLVIGTRGTSPIRFRVTLDGRAPGASHGGDIDASGAGVAEAHRLYQLIRMPENDGREHVFRIEFLGPGAQAYAFTFG